jgi:hypothetical protein
LTETGGNIHPMGTWIAIETVEISPLLKKAPRDHGQRLQPVQSLLPLSPSFSLRSALASRLYPRGAIRVHRPASSKLAPVSI